ncbi:hypothetical protein [Enterovirga sp. CN4-39]|uniref:hypothetical protein n=1 Tax=Enterovirga sp. CN4-39 TaxID=3400910 RepID=UPI003C0A69C7
MKPAFKALIQIRTEPELRAAIEAAAERDRTSISEYLRRELRAVVSGSRGSAQQSARAA